MADIGTGSGAIAVSLALHLPGVQFYAADISQEALEIARRNAYKFNVLDQVCLLQGNLLDPIPEPVDLIIANLPYIKHDEMNTLCPEINAFEPRIALDGGNDGLYYIRHLIQQSKMKLRDNSCIMLEIGYDQSQQVESLVYESFNDARIRFVSDPNDLKRVIQIYL